MYRHNSGKMSAVQAVKTTFTMAGYPVGHRAALTSTGSCHLLGGSEDSSVHWRSFSEEAVVSSMQSVQIRWENSGMTRHYLPPGLNHSDYAILTQCGKGRLFPYDDMVQLSFQFS